MPSTGTLLAFLGTAMLLLLLPGPGVLYVVSRSLTQGRGAGLASAAGLSVGAAIQALAATAGLSALLLASSAAFGFVKALGAGYLIYLGVSTMLAAQDVEGRIDSSARTNRRLFRDGVLVSVLNPKIAVFFMAFLPQFVDPARGSVSGQILLLGLLYSMLALVTDSGYALLAATLRGRLHGPFVRGPAPKYVSGAVYVGLGIGTAFAERR